MDANALNASEGFCAEECLSRNFKPLPILSIGVTGHRDIALNGQLAGAIGSTVKTVLELLVQQSCEIFAASEIFAAVPSSVRVIGMAADGADLIAMSAANEMQLPLDFVFPFSKQEYRADFSNPVALQKFDDLSIVGEHCFELSGNRQEGPRSYERANNIIISNCDLMIAIWDGLKARGAGGTGDVVQESFERGIPVIIIDSTQADNVSLLATPNRLHNRKIRAIDARRKDFPADLEDILGATLNPPNLAGGRILKDMFQEESEPKNIRFEYAALLKTFASVRTKKNVVVREGDDGWIKAIKTAGLCNEDSSIRLQELWKLTAWIDRLATHYGGQHRSSNTSSYILAMAVSLSCEVVGLLIPSSSTFTLSLQALVGGFILLDGWNGSRRRWHEKWLSYRCIAERIKTLRFLHLFGLDTRLPRANARHSVGLTTTDWFVARISRSLGAPNGVLSASCIQSAFEQLQDFETTEQIAYHKKSYRQLGALDEGLVRATSVSIAAIIILALVSQSAGFWGTASQATFVRELTTIVLAALPAALAAFKGIRADGDIVRLIERSAWSSAFLSRVKRNLLSYPRTYDNYEERALDVSSFMAIELFEWQAVLESRRSRLSRRKAFKRQALKRLFGRFQNLFAL